MQAKHAVRLLAGMLLSAILVLPVPLAGAAQQSALTSGYSVPGLGFPFFSVMTLDGQDRVIAQQTGNFNADDGPRVTENILTSIGATPDNPGFEALFAANDDMVTGAVQAIHHNQEFRSHEPLQYSQYGSRLDW